MRSGWGFDRHQISLSDLQRGAQARLAAKGDGTDDGAGRGRHADYEDLICDEIERDHAEVDGEADGEADEDEGAEMAPSRARARRGGASSTWHDRSDDAAGVDLLSASLAPPAKRVTGKRSREAEPIEGDAVRHSPCPVTQLLPHVLVLSRTRRRWLWVTMARLSCARAASARRPGGRAALRDRLPSTRPT